MRMLDFDDAVSELTGMMLMLVIVSTSLGVIMLIGTPQIDSAKDNARERLVLNSFMVFSSDVSQVVKGPITNVYYARTTTIPLSEGFLSINPCVASFSLSFTTDSGSTDVFSNLTPGNVKTASEAYEIVYENGAAIARYTGSSIIQSEPMIYASHADGNNIAIVVHVVNITQCESSIGGSGTVVLRTTHNSLNFTSAEATTSPNARSVTITIDSDYEDAWERYFNRELTDAGLTQGTDFTITSSGSLVIDVFNTGAANTDIYLTAYESRIKVEII